MTKSIMLKTHVGADGVIKLQVPAGVTNTDVDVVLVWVPLESKPKGADALGWPPGFFEQTAGAWQGEKLSREPQGEYEIRDEMK
jgi:hypothetical protein